MSTALQIQYKFIPGKRPDICEYFELIFTPVTHAILYFVQYLSNRLTIDKKDATDSRTASAFSRRN